MRLASWVSLRREIFVVVDVPKLLMLCQTIGMSVVVLALACVAVACDFVMSYCFDCMLPLMFFAIYVCPSHLLHAVGTYLWC